ncbi:hypothetical protein FGB62_6g136 [Gracilaria domingensis]|nr:hypothetical protein FGB62_6g136 [Gracilaria domingensis]
MLDAPWSSNLSSLEDMAVCLSRFLACGEHAVSESIALPFVSLQKGAATAVSGDAVKALRSQGQSWTNFMNMFTLLFPSSGKLSIKGSLICLVFIGDGHLQQLVFKDG